jgi:hypothetical protein
MCVLQLKVYFAHAKPDYSSLKESIISNVIIQDQKLAGLYPADIQLKTIDPGKPEYQDTCVHNLMDYWFGLVRKCNMLVFVRFESYITAGVGAEIELALSLGMPVYEVNLIQFGGGNAEYTYGVKQHYITPEYLGVEQTRALIMNYVERD